MPARSRVMNCRYGSTPQRPKNDAHASATRSRASSLICREPIVQSTSIRYGTRWNNSSARRCSSSSVTARSLS